MDTLARKTTYALGDSDIIYMNADNLFCWSWYRLLAGVG